jgi:hypothetical protein
MKIDFGARYRDVSKLLRASASASSTAHNTAFERDLRSLLPNKAQSQEVTAEPAPPQDARTEARARFNFDPPEQELPAPPPAMVPPSPAPTPVPAAPPSTGSVKTPTLVSVKRIELAEGTLDPLAARRAEITTQLQQAGERFGVDPTLAAAVVQAESSFNPRAVSSDGHASKGLFQLLDSTGKDLLARTEAHDRRYDPFDPQLNIELGTSYLRYLHDIFRADTTLTQEHRTVGATDPASVERLAVAAFNAGEGRVASAQQRAEKAGKDPSIYDHVAQYLPASTRSYVARVFENRKEFT